MEQIAIPENQEPNEKIIFTGLFLNEPQKEQLIEKLVPKHPVVKLEHITLQFLLSQNLAPEKYLFPLGEKFTVELTKRIWDSQAECVLVEIKDPENKLAKKPNLHITVSLDYNVRPIYSNDLIKKSEQPETQGKDFPETEIINPPIELELTASYFLATKDENGKDSSRLVLEKNL